VSDFISLLLYLTSVKHIYNSRNNY